MGSPAGVVQEESDYRRFYLSKEKNEERTQPMTVVLKQQTDKQAQNRAGRGVGKWKFEEHGIAGQIGTSHS